MRIRALTLFCNPGFPPNRLLLQQVGVFANHVSAALGKAGFPVASLRMATPPLGSFLTPADLPHAAGVLAIETHAEGFEYLALGPARADHLEEYAQIPAILGQSPALFASGFLTTPQHAISLPAARACARVITSLAGQEPDGFANLRFTALANTQPNGPFFPSAYAAPGAPAFALAIEGADLALEAFTNAISLEAARESLAATITDKAKAISTVVAPLAKAYGIPFKGFDFTLAPFPDQANSIALALEALGLPAFGLHGSLLASAFLTETLDRAEYPRVGFNGLMLPVLEDSRLAELAGTDEINLQSLLTFSAVCGTGLDVIPLPGDTSAEELFPLLLDVAALALRLDKPLTARLMPIPGKRAGEMTSFGFEYFANAAIMPVHARPLHGLLNNAETLELRSRNPKAE